MIDWSKPKCSSAAHSPFDQGAVQVKPGHPRCNPVRSALDPFCQLIQLCHGVVEEVGRVMLTCQYGRNKMNGQKDMTHQSGRNCGIAKNPAAIAALYCVFQYLAVVSGWPRGGSLRCTVMWCGVMSCGWLRGEMKVMWSVVRWGEVRLGEINWLVARWEEERKDHVMWCHAMWCDTMGCDVV